MSKNKREYVELASDKIIRLEGERNQLLERLKEARMVFNLATLDGPEEARKAAEKLMSEWDFVIGLSEGRE
jgi:hypothetical protein